LGPSRQRDDLGRLSPLALIPALTASIILARRDTIVAQEASLQADANPLQALTPTNRSNPMVEATKSYKERMREARAKARAKRDAEKAEWHRRAELRYR